MLIAKTPSQTSLVSSTFSLGSPQGWTYLQFMPCRIGYQAIYDPEGTNQLNYHNYDSVPTIKLNIQPAYNILATLCYN